jgi:diaminohydroxyphosphoribosylaminopyrimidine deaminase/5-amino-6-(5-phosphoribosylamino)uracil reductase
MSNPSSIDETYMKRCLQIALQGLGNVSPNPMVGCVIVHNDLIIGEGYHIKYREPHAEVNAINSVKDKKLLESSTLYVNLEPCSHFGKTPPCADLIIKYKIPRVVIGAVDCNEKVCGKGIDKLIKAGCQVQTGLLEKESRYLNRRFFTFHEKKRPYVMLKWAETQDGFMDRIREPNSEKKPNWISSERTRVIVHKWRAEEDAIMVGTNTALSDNPVLTTRDWKGKNPIRVILDRNLTLPTSMKLFNDEARTLVFNTIKTDNHNNIQYYKVDFDEQLIENILQVLYKEKIQSLIVEGGAFLLNSFIKSGLWDEAIVIKGTQYYRDGLPAPKISKVATKTVKVAHENYLYFNND